MRRDLNEAQQADLDARDGPVEDVDPVEALSDELRSLSAVVLKYVDEMGDFNESLRALRKAAEQAQETAEGFDGWA